MGRILTLAVFAACAASCGFTVTENHFFYPGPAATTTLPHIAGLEITPISIVAIDGVTLGGLEMRQPDAVAEILYFGGNASRADDMAAFLAPIVAGARVNLTMVDYRGYGRSGGHPTISALKADALSIADWMRARTRDRPLVVHGVSLGGFVAAYVAANRPLQGLVLEATAPDALSWAKHQVPLIARPVVRLNIAPALLGESNIEQVKRYPGPLLTIAGSKDTITPPRFLQQLLEASPSSYKRAVIVPGARHGGALIDPAARQSYAQFLERVRADVWRQPRLATRNHSGRELRRAAFRSR